MYLNCVYRYEVALQENEKLPGTSDGLCAVRTEQCPEYVCLSEVELNSVQNMFAWMKLLFGKYCRKVSVHSLNVLLQIKLLEFF